MGNNMLEDGLYVLEDKLKDPAFFDKMVRFVKASMKGWEYAIANPDEAAQIVVDNGGQDIDHQKYMMGEVAKLVAGSNGVLDPTAFDRTAQMVLDQKIIQNKPEGAWTHDVTDKAVAN
jgi:NitT/TauT family transport system substrate-binding protein